VSIETFSLKSFATPLSQHLKKITFSTILKVHFFGLELFWSTINSSLRFNEWGRNGENDLDSKV
jgi:hypothetical protein